MSQLSSYKKQIALFLISWVKEIQGMALPFIHPRIEYEWDHYLAGYNNQNIKRRCAQFREIRQQTLDCSNEHRLGTGDSAVWAGIMKVIAADTDHVTSLHYCHHHGNNHQEWSAQPGQRRNVIYTFRDQGQVGDSLVCECCRLQTAETAPV